MTTKINTSTTSISTGLPGSPAPSSSLGKIIATVVGVAAVWLAYKHLTRRSPSAPATSPTPPIKPATPPIIEKPPVPQEPVSTTVPKELVEVVNRTPQFNSYMVINGSTQVPLSAVLLRPSNLFLGAIKKGEKTVPKTTMPGSGELFAFSNPDEVRGHIYKTPRSQIVKFSANNIPGQYLGKDGGLVNVANLAVIYGPNTYEISYGELQDTLDSQNIFCSPMLPQKFYQELKVALINDKHVVLPGYDPSPVLMKDLTTPTCKRLLEKARKNPKEFGFIDAASLEKFLGLSIYQVGAMVVKTEDFRIFTDGNGQILQRTAGAKDAVRLINACGIRGIRRGQEELNSEIMRGTFATALESAESGYTIFPAVGMGVWGGDPKVYWNSFLNAVAYGATNLEQIFVNPGHKPSPYGDYKGETGNEFAGILEFHMQYHRDNNNPAAVKNLEKIVNLYEKRTDVLQLARNLKTRYPDKTVSIFNASDPDVTLGNHVTEYMNNAPHNAATTEEHYSMIGTNLLCFESITGISRLPLSPPSKRIRQAKKVF